MLKIFIILMLFFSNVSVYAAAPRQQNFDERFSQYDKKNLDCCTAKWSEATIETGFGFKTKGKAFDNVINCTASLERCALSKPAIAALAVSNCCCPGSLPTVSCSAFYFGLPILRIYRYACEKKRESFILEEMYKTSREEAIKNEKLYRLSIEEETKKSKAFKKLAQHFQDELLTRHTFSSILKRSAMAERDVNTWQRDVDPSRWIGHDDSDSE